MDEGSYRGEQGARAGRQGDRSSSVSGSWQAVTRCCGEGQTSAEGQPAGSRPCGGVSSSDGARTDLCPIFILCALNTLPAVLSVSHIIKTIKT